MAATVAIRVDEETRDKLIRIAKREHRSVGEMVRAAVNRYEREAFFDGLDESFARLRADPAAWEDYRMETSAYDGALMDGLRDNPWEE